MTMTPESLNNIRRSLSVISGTLDERNRQAGQGSSSFPFLTPAISAETRKLNAEGQTDLADALDALAVEIEAMDNG